METTFETYAREAESIKVTVKGKPGFGFDQYDDGNTDNPRTFTFGPEDMGEEVHRYIQSRNAFKITVHLDPHLKIDGTLPEWIEPGGSVTVKIVSTDSSYIFDYWSDREGYETDNPSTRTWVNVQSDIEVTAKECESFLFQVNISGTGSRAISLSNKTATCSKRRVKITNRRSHEEWDGAAVTIPAGYVAYVDRVFTSGSGSLRDTLAVSGGNWTVTGDWIKGWIGRTKTSIPAYAFLEMFRGQTGLISCQDSNYSMSAGEYAFGSTFLGCSGLTTCPRVTPTGSWIAPKGIHDSCFYNCTGISGKGNNNFKNYSSYSSEGYQFYNAFRGCTKLTANPADWFTWNSSHTTTYAYAYCFYGCTSLTRVGYNPYVEGGSAISYNYTSSSSAGYNYCYYYMFGNCTSLKSAYIWCGYLGTYSHGRMFQSCTNLSLIYMCNGNNTYHSQGSHCYYMAAYCSDKLWIVSGRGGSNTNGYVYTGTDLANIFTANDRRAHCVTLRAYQSGQSYGEVYDWYNWGYSHYASDTGMYWSDRPIVVGYRTSWSSGYTDYFVHTTIKDSTTHNSRVFPQHYTGWIGRWGIRESKFYSELGSFSTKVWATRTYTADDNNVVGITHTENRSGGGHWSDWGFAMQFEA